MKLSSILAFSALAALSNAVPTPAEHVARSCSILLPTTYQTISQSSPSTSFPQGRTFKVSQDANGVNDIDTLLQFTRIPAGAYGCQLNARFGFEAITSSGSTQVNAYKLANDITQTSNYAQYFPNGGRSNPANAFLFGTITLNGSPVVVNSATCSGTLNFLFNIASDTQSGSVQFVDQGNNLSGISGFFLTYNC